MSDKEKWIAIAEEFGEAMKDLGRKSVKTEVLYLISITPDDKLKDKLSDYLEGV